MPVIGRMNVYGASGLNQYGMPNINPQIPVNASAGQFMKPIIPVNLAFTNNLIKPPNSENNTNGNLFVN